MWLVIIIIIISNTAENLLYAIVPCLFTFKIIVFTPSQLSNYFIALRVIDLFRQLLPFSIAFLTSYAIQYFASIQLRGDPDQDNQ